nr:hypothetical protein [Tanacetum cinerariifolium]
IINPQETQKVATRDEKWVPFTESVNISSTNVRLETIVPQKEETFQVVQGTESYEFFLANKKRVVNADVFRMLLDIYPRVESVDFTNVSDDNIALTFLIELGYKGLLYKHTNMFMDHMHQPWRTLAVIINKCLSGNTTSNDKIRKSKIDIPWGMFYRENVDYPELMGEDHAFLIDQRKEKRSRCENMSFSRFTKIIINHFLKQYKSLSNLKYQQYHTIKDDGISESYQMFIKYSTGQIPPKKSRGKVKRKTASRRVVKKKVTISADDNIIPNPDIALELGKSMILTEAEEAETARKVRATHARIVTESVLEPTKRRKSGKMTFDPRKRLKGVPSLTLEQQEAADTMKALLEKVPDESTFISATSSEGTDNETKFDEDEIYKYKIRVHKDKDEKMLNDEVEYSGKGNAEVSNVAKADPEKTEEAKDDSKKVELPKTSTSLSISSGFGDEFIKLSSDTTLVSTVKDTIDAEISSLLDIKI